MGQKMESGVCAQKFQRTRIGLCIKVIYMQLMTSHKVCGIFKELEMLLKELPWAIFIIKLIPTVI